MPEKAKIIRMSTVGLSLDVFCRDLLRELSEDYDVVALSSPDESLRSAGAREGVRTVGVTMERRISLWADLKALAKLIRIMRRERPLMLHTITPKAGLLGMIAAKIAGVPLRVHTFTGLLFPTSTGLRRQILRLTDKLTCACATHIIPEGEGVKSDLIEGGITDKPLRVLGYGNIRGVDTESYSRSDAILSESQEIRRRLGIPDGARVAIFIGRFVGDKGLRELAEAFRSIDRQDFHLILAGGFEADSPKGEISKADLDGIPRLHFSDGWISDIRPWLAAADFHIHPSYREGFPNTVLEAGAMSIPSIVTDINGSREIITDGVNGLIVPPRSAEKLAAAMKTLLDPPEFVARMGIAARENVVEKFRCEFVRSCLKNYYKEIIAETVGKPNQDSLHSK